MDAGDPGGAVGAGLGGRAADQKVAAGQAAGGQGPGSCCRGKGAEA